MAEERKGGKGEVAEELMGRRREVVVLHNNVIHTIDSIVQEYGKLVPVEIKTTRASSPSVKKPLPPAAWNVLHCA